MRPVFLLAVRGGVALAAALAAVGFLPSQARAQGETRLGVTGAGEVGFEYAGQIEQMGPLSDDFGYLSELAGIDESKLFTGQNPMDRSEATARFTFFSSAKRLTRSENVNLLNSAGTGETTLYFNDAGGASFADPSSFRKGVAVATYSSTWQDVLSVYARNMAIASIVAFSTQKAANPFTLGGTRYVLGEPGLTLRLTFTGVGMRTEPTEPRATIRYGGSATILAGGALPAAAGAGGGTSGWTYVALGVAVAALLVGLVAAVGVWRRSAAGRSPG